MYVILHVIYIILIWYHISSFEREKWEGCLEEKKKALEFDIFVNIELLISLMFIFFEKDKWILYASRLLVIKELWTLQPEKVLHQLQKCCSPLFYILYLHGKIVIKIWKGYYGIIIVNGFCVLLLSVNLHNKIMNPPPRNKTDPTLCYNC